MKRRAFTLIMPYFENPTMLVEQCQNLSRFPAQILECLHLIVCDDGSPDNPARAVARQQAMNLATFQLFRVDVDVRWNWLTCRNIGVHHATTGWVLMTDIDHLLPEATARRIIEGPLDEKCAYRFSRVDAPDMTPTLDRHGKPKPHPNTWLMTRALFDKVGGYDERYSGYYGTDGMFARRVQDAARGVIILPDKMIRVPREVVPDASTTRYGRKEQQDREGVARIRAQIEREGGPTKRLSFPYHRVV